MKIYTRTGDKGITSLIGGKRVPKYHLRIEAYGTIDELIAYVGLVRDQNINNNIINTLILIQDKLMTCSAILASDCDDCNIKLPEITENDSLVIEQEIDKFDDELAPLNSFILPGGNTVVSFCHIARTICRRAERIIIKLSEESFVPESLIKYINRLSDYFFVLSRKLGKDFNIKEIHWQPKL